MMDVPVKVSVVVFLLVSVVNAEFDFDLEAASSVNWGAEEPLRGRELQQAGVKPCRWNPNFSSCDFNYDYVAQIKPTTPAAIAARQWFINAKVCDSAPYQASQALCNGDNARFCKYVGGTGSVKCTALLQPFYNYYLACAGSVAKAHFLCSSKFTPATCTSSKLCRWLRPAGRTPYCARTPTFSAPQEAKLATYLNSDNLQAFRAAWGVCDGSNTAYNQTICSKQTTKARCTGTRYCTWGVFSTGGVCYTNAVWSPVFLYQNDASFKFLLQRCNQKTQAACEGAPAAAKLVANSESG